MSTLYVFVAGRGAGKSYMAQRLFKVPIFDEPAVSLLDQISALLDQSCVVLMASPSYLEQEGVKALLEAVKTKHAILYWKAGRS